MRRRLVILAAFLGTVLWAQTAFSQMYIKQAGNFGLGIGAGTFATGLSMKYFLSSDTSIQGNVGWWRGGYYCRNNSRYSCGFYRDALALSADFLLERGPLTGNSDITLDWEIGAGVGLGFDDTGDFGLGVSGVAGLQVNIHALPIDLVLEYRPGFLFVPGFGLDLINFTGHVRYYF